MKPVIFYVDDEPFNLTVFEAAMPEEWEIKTFESPLSALKEIERYQPWVIISDQRMPSMNGVEFLELCFKVREKAVRMVATGYSDESLIIDTVRKAKIFDYIRKPWDANDLAERVKRAIESYTVAEEKRRLVDEILEKNRTTEQTLASKEFILQGVQDELVRSNMELEQFAYLASHDLQEPLRKIASFCGLLQQNYQGKLSDDADRWIGFAVDGAKRMQTLINDLLNYSRVENRTEAPKETNCAEVVAQAISSLELTIKEAHACVTFDPMPVVMADKNQLTQVFQNLISNGIKFKGDARPAVHVSATKERDVWLFSVKDNGIGISSDNHDKVFKIFKRLNHKESYPGNGMGLAICKRIIERLGGKIWLESEAGKGCTFKFTLLAPSWDSATQPSNEMNHDLKKCA
jgi:signal transduction histidine kinase